MDINSKEQCSAAPDSTCLKLFKESFNNNANSVENMESIVKHLIENAIHPLAETEIDSAICIDVITHGCKEQKLSKPITDKLITEFKTHRSKLSHGSHEGFYSYNKNGESKINEVAVARWIAESDEHYISTADGLWWRYYQGVYLVIDKQEIKKRIIDVLDPDLVKDRTIESIMAIASCLTFITYERFDEDPNIVNCKNGLFNIKTGTLTAHTPDYISTIQFPVNLIESINDVKCPLFNAFLDSVMSSDKDQVKLIYQMIGYLCTSHNMGKKAFVLYGPGNTGKTTLMNIIRFLIIGDSNCSSVALQDLEKDFATSALLGKAMNSFDDLPARKLEDNGVFKAITGGGPVCINRKHKDMINAVLPVKFLFATNNLPTNISGDRSEAFYNRFIFIKLDHIVSNEERDPLLLDKIAPECDSIFTLAMCALKELDENRYVFCETEKNESIKKQYRIQNDTVEQFVEDLFSFASYAAYPCKKAFDLYDDYCNCSKLKPCSRSEFKRRLLSIKGISEAQEGDDRKRCYKGICLLKEKFEDSFPKSNWNYYNENILLSHPMSLSNTEGENHND